MKRFSANECILICLVLAKALSLASCRTNLESVGSSREYRHLCKKLLHLDQGVKRNTFFDLPSIYEERRPASIEGSRQRGCPDFHDYIRRHNEPAMRTVSPSGPIHDYDPRRYPRVIIHHACLCKHCFDPATMAPDHNLASYNMTATINVSYRDGKTRKYDIITGCTCVIPTTRAASQ